MSGTRCGYVALLGAPNAGKSTLLNALIGSRLSIVTPKPQTTRGLLKGIAIEENSQLIFIDTPGIFEAKLRFEKAMVAAAWQGAQEADVRLLMVDAHKGLDGDTQRIAEKLSSAVLVLNKVDKVEKQKLPELAKALYGLKDFERSFMVSAKTGNGVKDLLRYLAGRVPEAPWLFPEDELTDASERMLATEITREQCFLKLHEELPYGLMVETEKWEEKQAGKDRVLHIRQLIRIVRESHKKILLGKAGTMLKSIGSAARRRMGETFGATVHLFLFVKVDESWKDKPESFKAVGLEYKK